MGKKSAQKDKYVIMRLMEKKILLSGVKPTGLCHIGNYFGAMKQFVDLAEKYQSYIFIADLHALNLIQNKKEMEDSIINILLDYLAIGLNPKKVVIFKQSDILEHTQLTWIFDSLTTMPYLMRAHAYKDAENKNKEINVGTFNYPMLMSADILLYDADIVPIGQDQKQHVEYARDTAQKFNNIFGETFKLPEPLILKDVAIVPGTDGRKMSKSYGNIIPLFGTKEEIIKSVMSIVTNSGEGIPENIYNIHKLLRPEEELRKIYAEKTGKYKELKELLIEDLEKLIAPMREKREKLARNIPRVLKNLKKGNKKAQKIATKKMKEIKVKVGLQL